MACYRLFLSVALLLACLALAACGNDQKPAPVRTQAAGIEPCSLVTKAEAETALGQAVRAPESKPGHDPLGQALCFYAAAADDSISFVQVSLASTQGMSAKLREQGYTAARLFQDSKALLETAQAMPGVGDEAFYGGSGIRAGAGLHVLKGDYYLNVSVNGGDKELERARELAIQALSRLP